MCHTMENGLEIFSMRYYILRRYACAAVILLYSCRCEINRYGLFSFVKNTILKAHMRYINICDIINYGGESVKTCVCT